MVQATHRFAGQDFAQAHVRRGLCEDTGGAGLVQDLRAVCIQAGQENTDLPPAPIQLPYPP